MPPAIDGYIATEVGGIDWLNEVGGPKADMQGNQDMAFNAFMQQVAWVY